MSKRRILLVEVEPKLVQPRQYATWSPVDRHPDIALSGGNLAASKSTVGEIHNWACVAATATASAGQIYWETRVIFSGVPDFGIGMQMRVGSGFGLYEDPGGFMGVRRSFAVNRAGAVRYGGTAVGALGAVISGDIIRLHLDADTGVHRIARNNGPWVVLPVGSRHVLYPICGILRLSGTTASITANFGATPFAYPVPDGVNPGVYSDPEPVPTVIYMGSEGFNAQPVKSDPPRVYQGRIAGDQDVIIEREMSCYVWGGQTRQRAGQIVFINADGGLDDWANMSWRDAPITLLKGYEGDAREDFQLYSTGIVDRDPEFTSDGRIVLALTDPLAQADKPLQPELYPDDFANAALAGKPLPIVLGKPLFCSGLLQTTLTTGPDANAYQLHDVADVIITDVYDNGDRFIGPDDPYAPTSIITAANGGDFTGTWAGTPALPPNWTALTAFGATTNRVIAPGSGGGIQVISDGTVLVGIQHSVSVPMGRYTLTFTSAVTTAGTLYFRVGAQTVAYALTGSGGQSVNINVTKPGRLQILAGPMNGPITGLNATVRNLRLNSTPAVDWSYWPGSVDATGFKLTNKPWGRVTAHPVALITTRLDLAMHAVAARVGISGQSTVMPATIGDYITTPTTGLATLRKLLDAVCGCLTARRDGVLVARQVQAPSNVAMLQLDSTNLHDAPVVTFDAAPGLTTRIAGQRNQTPHTFAEVATSVSDPNSPVYNEALVQRLTSEWGATRSAAPHLTTAVATAYAHAEKAGARGTVLQDAEQMQAEINRVATLWRQRRHFYAVSALLDEHAELEPGDTVRLVWPRFGLDAGKNLLVIGVSSRFFSRRVDLKLWG